MGKTNLVTKIHKTVLKRLGFHSRDENIPVYSYINTILSWRYDSVLGTN